MKQTTLCFLIKETQVLLAMKRRGFGEGKWNGVGGKQHPGETPEEANAREALEEIGVTLITCEKVAELSFSFPEVPEKGWDQLCHVYICTEWKGEPAESEEMTPRWFAKTEVPYDTMWPDDILWLPLVLEESKKVRAAFTLSSDQKMLSHFVQEHAGNF